MAGVNTESVFYGRRGAVASVDAKREAETGAWGALVCERDPSPTVRRIEAELARLEERVGRVRALVGLR